MICHAKIGVMIYQQVPRWSQWSIYITSNILDYSRPPPWHGVLQCVAMTLIWACTDLMHINKRGIKSDTTTVIFFRCHADRIFGVLDYVHFVIICNHEPREQKLNSQKKVAYLHLYFSFHSIRIQLRIILE